MEKNQLVDSNRITQLLLEAFDTSKKGIGIVQYPQSKLSDPHIRQIIDATAKKLGIPASDIDNQIKAHVTKIEEMKQYSQLLYETAAQCAVNDAVFELVEHARQPHFPKFEASVFVKLCDMIQMEHQGQFFPLRAPRESNFIYDINPILVPSREPKEAVFNSITRAACDAQGHFIFNVGFMQNLMDWATIAQVKPQGKKYQSNGGDIPDAYVYVEFVILHELLHYVHGDFKTSTQLKQFSHTVHNMAMDFRSNYLLVKNQYDAPPNILLSDHLNLDRQDSYEELVTKVHEELQKLPKDLQDVYENIVGQFDEHDKSRDASDQKKKKPQPKKDQKPKKPQEKKAWVPKVGDIIFNKKTGQHARVTAVDATTGKVTVGNPLTPEELKKENIKV
jgi:hypothetical protein